MNIQDRKNMFLNAASCSYFMPVCNHPHTRILCSQCSISSRFPSSDNTQHFIPLNSTHNHQAARHYSGSRSLYVHVERDKWRPQASLVSIGSGVSVAATDLGVQRYTGCSTHVASCGQCDRSAHVFARESNIKSL